MGIVSLIHDYRLIHGLSREEEIMQQVALLRWWTETSHGNPGGGEFLFIALSVYQQFNFSHLYVLYEGYI
jgi:hypothetical protein